MKTISNETMAFMSLIQGSDAVEWQEEQGQHTICSSSELPIKYNGNATEKATYLEKLNKMGIEILEEVLSDELFMKVKLPEGWSIKPTSHSMWSHLEDNNGNERASIFYKAAFYDRDSFISFNKRFSISKVFDYNEEDFREKPEYIVDGYEEVIEVGELLKDLGGCFVIPERKTVRKPNYKKNPDYVKLTGYERYSQPFHYEVQDVKGIVTYKSEVVKTDFDYKKEEHWDFFRHLEEVENRAKMQCVTWLEENYPEWKDELAYWL